MVNYGRSGGTVLARCLASLPDVVLLSEVNPLGVAAKWNRQGTITALKGQARDWYGIELKSDTFADAVVELEQVCKATGKRLVVRDWSYPNFAPHKTNRRNPPRRFLTLEALEGRARVIPFAFVRNAIDAYISMPRGRKPGEYFSDYLAYVKALTARELPIFRYEDFCRNPDDAMLAICRCAGIPFSTAYRDFGDYANVTGDVQLGQGSRGIRAGMIKPMKRKKVPASMARAIDRCADMVEANRMLNYGTRYGRFGLFL